MPSISGLPAESALLPTHEIPATDPTGGSGGTPRTVRLPGSAFQPALSVGGTALDAVDATLFTGTGGTLSIVTTGVGALATAGSLTGAMQTLVLDSGVLKVATLAALAGEFEMLTLPAMNLTSMAGEAPNAPISIAGTLVNYRNAPFLSYGWDGADLVDLPAGATVSTSGFAATLAGLPSGTHTLTIADQNDVSTTATLVVAPIQATSATLSGVPGSVVAGSAISGAAAALEPAYSTGYAVLTQNGADVGTRQAFQAGSAVPGLTPSTAGTYALDVFANLTGGTALASGTVIVTALAATGATLAGVPTAATAGTAISGVTTTLTPASSTGYAVLRTGGADEGVRVGFTGSSVPAIAPAGAGTYQLAIYGSATGGAPIISSSNIAVTILATAATIAGAPSTGIKGQALAGITDTLSPAGATGYAVLYVNGADEGSRQPFTGTSFPSLAPQVGGNYLAKIYPTLTGGTASATSSVIAVAVPATGAALSGVPASDTAGTAISGASVSMAPSTATGYAVLTQNGLDVGARTAVTSGTLAGLVPAAPGTFQVAIYAAATGGTALTQSGNITVTAAVAPSIGANVAPSMVLDASANTLYADSSFTTAQATNGGTVQGWKDGSGGGNSVTGSGSNAPTLATASANNLNGVVFAAGAAPYKSMSGAGSLASAAYAAANTGGAGLTIALVFKYAAVASAGEYLFYIGNPDGHYVAILQDGGGNLSAVYVNNGTQSGFLSAPAAGTLIKMVAVFNPSTSTVDVTVNALTGPQANGQLGALGGSVWNTVIVGNAYQSAGFVSTSVYEIDVWETAAGGTGGAAPTGDVATIMAYLTNKWGS